MADQPLQAQQAARAAVPANAAQIQLLTNPDDALVDAVALALSGSREQAQTLLASLPGLLARRQESDPNVKSIVSQHIVERIS